MKRYVDIDQLVDIERFDYNVEPCVETVPIHRLINFYVCEPSTVEIADVREVISSLWIPVAERLPEKTGWYFLTCINQFGHKICRVAHYDYDDWTDSKGFGVQVLAWMPVPEPYKGDK